MAALAPAASCPLAPDDLARDWVHRALEIGQVFNRRLYGVDLLIAEQGSVAVDVNAFDHSPRHPPMAAHRAAVMDAPARAVVDSSVLVPAWSRLLRSTLATTRPVRYTPVWCEWIIVVAAVLTHVASVKPQEYVPKAVKTPELYTANWGNLRVKAKCAPGGRLYKRDSAA